MTGQFALARVRGQHFAMALVARTLAHVKFTSFKVVLGVNFSGAFFKERGFEGIAEAVALDSGRPRLFTLGLV